MCWAGLGVGVAACSACCTLLVGLWAVSSSSGDGRQRDKVLCRVLVWVGLSAGGRRGGALLLVEQLKLCCSLTVHLQHLVLSRHHHCHSFNITCSTERESLFLQLCF